LVAPDGNVVWRTNTTIWGAGNGISTGGVDCRLRFPGQYHDSETGDHYTYFRYYSPQAGRFNTGDPIGLDGGDNPHRYVPNPTAWIDPLGLVGCFEDFAHGTSLAHAESIMQNGLSEAASRANEIHSHVPGSFFTIPVDPSNKAVAVETAAFWGGRAVGKGEPGAVIVLRLPKSVVGDLTARGLLERTEIPFQAVFHPGSYETLSRVGEWVAKVPFVKP